MSCSAHRYRHLCLFCNGVGVDLLVGVHGRVVMKIVIWNSEWGGSLLCL